MFCLKGLFWLAWCQQVSHVASLVSQEFITEYLPPLTGYHTRQMVVYLGTDMSN